ncbi:hypothetical protein KPH14_006539 [Odynerus spinipes]|uniref:Uncharacterized protein n=1 Tax=Odynerus spinipes TaxID=1348599 RepID=A0AAD9RQQ0_9HYME|nr:hypothetical protein KPH14_006539 [Odynerus spinipes]
MYELSAKSTKRSFRGGLALNFSPLSLKKDDKDSDLVGSKGYDSTTKPQRKSDGNAGGKRLKSSSAFRLQLVVAGAKHIWTGTSG